MLDFESVNHHPAIEEIVDILCTKTQNTDRGFFRVEAAYFLAKMAATMRATIVTKDRGEIPVNVYAIALATSGYGKGYSVSIFESELLNGFRKRFLEDTFQVVADQNMWQLAIERSAVSGKPEAQEKEKLEKEFSLAGEYPFTFAGGTPAAIQQVRQKLLLASCGAINLQVDEIGSNLVSAVDVLNVYLELYDQGMIKQKLTKNTAKNIRGSDLEGKTPTNALLFGTQSKLLDGGMTEDQFYSLLETGYARRSLFAWGDHRRASEELTPAELYARLVQPQNSQNMTSWANHFTQLADPAKYGWRMEVDDAVGIELLTYKIECERIADQMKEHEDIRKAEMSHRYFKALKLAGALAFVDESLDITLGHLHSAIKLVEESGLAFQRLLTREKPYVKLARFIADHKGAELTHADLHESLPFYKASNQARNELMTMAASWGYKHNIIIKKTYADGIEFFTGETLEETDIGDMILSYSDNFAFNYVKDSNKVPFDKLHMLTQHPDLHWANHQFIDQHRLEEKAIPGFNMVVFDVDGGVPIPMVQDLLKDYRHFIYTTKRHTDEEHRFRLIMPLKFILELDSDDYKAFMNGLMSWLPFATDASANQRSKKWMTHPGECFYNLEGDFLDPLPFIPKTAKNEHYQNNMAALESLDNLERWFAQRMVTGSRNNQMIKYAFALADSGMSYTNVEEAVLTFNSRLQDPLPVEELRNTILVSVAKKIHSNP